MRVRSQSTEHVESVHSGKSKIEDDEIGTGAVERFEPLLAARSGVDGEPLVFEEEAEHRPNLALVLDQ